MATIKLYSEVIVSDKDARSSFFGNPGPSYLQAILSVFFFNRNYHIQRRIQKIRKQSAGIKSWSGMTEQEHVSHIYKTMAVEKAIQRMLKLMN